ncbi:hypothetical protein LR48_Vigan08g021900 [Vigna angularis]|uniref:Uncharacterized protein n=1 Tax=Phaseolus angularis TaxID=3914 RepID=A0A0L9V391_PHAAN|nr:hypothetical protein LR48_Vigan08g021900 [Vigna angularis]
MKEKDKKRGTLTTLRASPHQTASFHLLMSSTSSHSISFFILTASPFPSLFCWCPPLCPPILSDSGTSEGWLVDTGLGILWLGLKMAVWGFRVRGRCPERGGNKSLTVRNAAGFVDAGFGVFGRCPERGANEMSGTRRQRESHCLVKVGRSGANSIAMVMEVARRATAVFVVALPICEGDKIAISSEISRKSGAMRVETFHHADKDKVEHYILELLVWLHHLVIKSKAGSDTGKVRPTTKYPVGVALQKTNEQSINII